MNTHTPLPLFGEVAFFGAYRPSQQQAIIVRATFVRHPRRNPPGHLEVELITGKCQHTSLELQRYRRWHTLIVATHLPYRYALELVQRLADACRSLGYSHTLPEIAGSTSSPLHWQSGLSLELLPPYRRYWAMVLPPDDATLLIYPDLTPHVIATESAPFRALSSFLNQPFDTSTVRPSRFHCAFVPRGWRLPFIF